MILRYVELEDFLSHEREAVSLPERGVILLTGTSGAGKSSLICDAVAYCLFGVKATRAKKAEELRRHGAEGEGFHAKIALELADGVVVEIERGVSAEGRSYASLVDSTGGYAEGAQPVARAIAELVGALDAQAYHRAFVSRQGELAALTAMEGAKRRDVIHNMLGVDVLDRMGKRLRSQIREHDAVIEHLRAEGAVTSAEALEEAVLGAAQAIATTEDARIAADAVAREAAAAVEASERDLAPRRAARAAREAAIRERDLARQGLEQLEAERSRIDADLAEMEGMRAQAASHPDAQADSDAARDALRALEVAASHADERARVQAQLEAEREVVDACAAQCAHDLGPAPAASSVVLGEERTQLAGEYRAAQAELSRLEANAAQLAEHGVCATCLRPSTGEEADRLASLFETQRADAKARLDAVAARGAEVKGALATASAYEAAVRAREEAMASMHAATERVAQAEARLAELPADIPTPAMLDAARTRLAEAEERLRVASQAAAWVEARATLASRREEIEAESQACSARLERAEATLAETATLGSDLTELEAAHVALVRAAGDAALALERARAAHEQARISLLEAERQRDAQIERAASLASREAARDRTERIGLLVADFRSDVVRRLRPQIEARTSGFLSTLSGGRHPALRLSEDYEIELRAAQQGPWLSMRMVSGGEEARANIALRLALTQLLGARIGAPIRYLVLDEIFTSQDPGHMSRMLEVLHEMQARFPQLFLISHVGDLAEQGLVDYVIEVADGQGQGRVSLSTR